MDKQKLAVLFMIAGALTILQGFITGLASSFYIGGAGFIGGFLLYLYDFHKRDSQEELEEEEQS